ncbi:MAG TPA: MogA/MoaB family molybdenum cofactor biosynthesis protein, partial [Actinomycetota bacterium]|nr:MogA/MoaB family molybdenum cofactor biosynthesis protein [Actinomycetota bacterium]
MKARVIVCSDSAAAGATEDTTGPVLVAGLRELGCEVEAPVVVPDDVEEITDAIQAVVADVVVCTGGTGLGPRDVTPDAVLALIDRELPGFGEAFRARGRAQTPLADLSRAVAGTRAGTLLVAIPGSHGAIADGLAVLGPLLDHAHHVIAG